MLNNTSISTSQGSNCIDGSDPACFTAVSVLVPALTISKTSNSSDVVAGGVVAYAISATNTGQAAYSAATLTDSLADVLDDGTFVAGSATSTTGALSYADSTLTWTGALAVGATVLISYTVSTNIDATGNSVLTNSAVSAVVGSSCPAGSANPLCTAITSIQSRSITLTDLTPAFTLTGPSNATVTARGAVTMTVTTNSPAGYMVTVTGSTALTSAATSLTIPVSTLHVRESGTTSFIPVTAAPIIVHEQDEASAPDGDAVSNDYQMPIPFAPPGTYSTTLEYIVTAR